MDRYHETYSTNVNWPFLLNFAHHPSFHPISYINKSRYKNTTKMLENIKKLTLSSIFIFIPPNSASQTFKQVLSQHLPSSYIPPWRFWKHTLPKKTILQRLIQLFSNTHTLPIKLDSVHEDRNRPRWWRTHTYGPKYRLKKLKTS